MKGLIDVAGNESEEDFLKMQQEAIRRVREMQLRARQTLENRGMHIESPTGAREIPQAQSQEPAKTAQIPLSPNYPHPFQTAPQYNSMMNSTQNQFESGTQRSDNTASNPSVNNPQNNRNNVNNPNNHNNQNNQSNHNNHNNQNNNYRGGFSNPLQNLFGGLMQNGGNNHNYSNMQNNSHGGANSQNQADNDFIPPCNPPSHNSQNNYPPNEPPEPTLQQQPQERNHENNPKNQGGFIPPLSGILPGGLPLPISGLNINLDKDQLMLLGTLYVLYRDGGDPWLMLALAYILFT